MTCLQLLLRGSTKTVQLETEGQVELPKQPPFLPVTPGPAVVVTLELTAGSPRMSRFFDQMYMQGWSMDVTAWDGGPCVRALVKCVEIDWARGLQITRPWSEPLRRAAGDDGLCLLYRPAPRHQLTKGTTNRYVLASDRWEQLAVPDCFKDRQFAVEELN